MKRNTFLEPVFSPENQVRTDGCFRQIFLSQPTSPPTSCHSQGSHSLKLAVANLRTLERTLRQVRSRLVFLGPSHSWCCQLLVIVVLKNLRFQPVFVSRFRGGRRVPQNKVHLKTKVRSSLRNTSRPQREKLGYKNVMFMPQNCFVAAIRALVPAAFMASL